MIVEDGTGIDNADSYISHADAVALAVTMGVPFPADQADGERALITGALYQSGKCYKGDKQYSNNALAFPRTVDPGVVPIAVINSQLLYASAVYGGANLWGATGRSNRVQSKKDGSTSVTYASSGRLNDADAVPAAEAWLSVLLCTPGSGMSFKVIRA